MPDKLCCQKKKPFSINNIIAFAVSSVSVAKSMNLQKQTVPVAKNESNIKKPQTDFMIHGRSLEVYVNEMELKYHKSTNVSMFVCPLSQVVSSERCQYRRRLRDFSLLRKLT